MTVEFGLILTICSVVIGVLGYQLNKKNQQMNLQQAAEKSAKVEGKMEATLNHISRGIDDIKLDVKTNKEQVNDVRKEVADVRREVAIVKEVADSSHKRIDEIVKK